MKRRWQMVAAAGAIAVGAGLVAVLGGDTKPLPNPDNPCAALDLQGAPRDTCEEYTAEHPGRPMP